MARQPHNRYTIWIGSVFLVFAIGALKLGNFASLIRRPFQFEIYNSMALDVDESLKSCSLALNQALLKVNNSNELEAENLSLRKALNFFKKHEWRYAIANVLGHDVNASSLLYIDLGGNDGIQEGQPVVTDDGILIGKILAISNQNATVELLTSDASRVTVKAGDTPSDDQETGLLRGYLNNSLQLEYILLATELAVNDLVVTATSNSKIPAGIPVGKVSKILDSPDQLFHTAIIDPLIDYQNVRIVSVITGS